MSAQAATTSSRACRPRDYTSDCIALIPFLQKVPEAAGLLDEVARVQDVFDKYRMMSDWIDAHPVEVAQVREVNIVRLTRNDVVRWVQPPGLGEKVYTSLPGQVRCFTGLQSLTLTNNCLTALPPLEGLPLETLCVGFNELAEMPEPLPTLCYLDLYANRKPFSSEQLTAFIRQYIANGGEYIEIVFHPALINDLTLDRLSAEIPDTHTLTVEASSIKVQRLLEPTQLLEME